MAMKKIFDKMIERSLTGINLHNTKGSKYRNAFHLFYTGMKKRRHFTKAFIIKIAIKYC